MNYYKEYDEYYEYDEYQYNNKQQKNNKTKQKKVSCYSSKHIRIQQSKKLKR